MQAKEMDGECTRVPKRLRGDIMGLMRELLVRYRRIEIETLAGHYLRLDQVSVITIEALLTIGIDHQQSEGRCVPTHLTTGCRGRSQS